MIYDLTENYNLYFKNPFWEKAFNFLKDLDASSPTGRIEIAGDDIFAMVNEYETLSHDNAIVETHRRYTDIQVLLTGKEQIYCCPVNELTIKTPYDESRDAAFYKPSAEPSVKLVMAPGVFAFFLPNDAHSPNLTFGNEPQKVKKVVIKIKEELLKC